MSLDLTEVALFVQACATRNLSAAGRELGLSPAATSARIAQLERRLGTRLLHRTTRSVALTQDGEAFLERARALLDAAEQAESAVGAASRAPQGLLRVAASVSFGRQHIVPALSDFLAQYPAVRLDLRLSDRIIDLAANAIDVAVRIGPPRDSALVVRKLAPSRMVLCASPGYLARRGMPCAPAQLKDHDCLVLADAQRWPFSLPDGTVQHVHVSGRFGSDNGEACRDAAVDSLGITLQSTWAVYRQLKAGTLVRVLPQFPVAIASQVSAAYLERSFLPSRTRAFIDYFAQRFGPHPYWDEEPGEQAHGHGPTTLR